MTLRTNRQGDRPLPVRLGEGNKQRSALSPCHAGCLGAKIGEKRLIFPPQPHVRRQGAHWLLACRRACLRSIHSVSLPWPARPPCRSGPIWVIATLLNGTSTTRPCGSSGCAAPAFGFASLNLRHRTYYSPSAQLRGPRLRHVLVLAGVMGVGLMADGTRG